MKLDKLFIFSISAWLLAFSWYFLIPDAESQYNANEETGQTIKRANRAIQLFKKQFQNFPVSMTELKAFIRLHNFELSLYDAYGHPLEYIPLSNDKYVLRSFGKDGGQNTLLLNQDQSGGNVSVLPSETSMLEYWLEPHLSTYPAVLVSGSNSPNREWYAKLYANYRDGKKRLVVHHRRKDNFFMVSRHDAIEEFMWLPSGYAMVYTATSSETYRDGIFYWDLLEDETVNLLAAGSIASNVAVPTGGTPRYMLSLAGINIEGSHAFFYLVHESYGNILSPIELFSSDALVKVSLPLSTNKKILITRAIDQEGLSLFESEEGLFTTFPSNTLSMAIQRHWQKLSLIGDIEQRISQWKSFIKTYKETPLYSYGLYYLMNLYHTAMSMESEDDQKSVAAREATMKTAQEIVEYPLAPSYLKAQARFTYYEAEAGNPIRYELPQLKK